MECRLEDEEDFNGLYCAISAGGCLSGSPAEMVSINANGYLISPPAQMDQCWRTVSGRPPTHFC
jgi:hypothetical protein